MRGKHVSRDEKGENRVVNKHHYEQDPKGFYEVTQLDTIEKAFSLQCSASQVGSKRICTVQFLSHLLSKQRLYSIDPQMNGFRCF